MKTVLLLAFVGLASCRVAFFERGDNLKVKYSYDDDDYDRDVDYDDDYRPRVVSSSFIRRPEPVQYAEVEVPRFRTQFVEVETPRPVYTEAVVPVRAAPTANVVTQYVRAEPAVAVPVARGVRADFDSRPRSTFFAPRRDVFRFSDDNISREDK
ncbi:uncharacterized protein LOC135205218 [Macrobrachium nipponense]|uniref:uncharacterized protein LOC135205218 n=1 Tax=Macrobrachium nipponense TaxID=159736 RepID=UPI0030C8BEB9